MLNRDQRQKIAALNTIEGFSILLDEVVKSSRDQALERLKLAKTRDEVTESGYNFRAWDTVLEDLKRTPKEIEQGLRDEGDTIYG